MDTRSRSTLVLMRSAIPRAALYAVFTLSGAAGLAYQAVWSRLFTNGLGHEMPAVLAIIASFFAGLSAGAWTLDSSIAGNPQPGSFYAILELFIGVWGMLSAALIPLVNEHAAQFIGLGSTWFRHWLFAFAAPLITLLPATFAMGATWPAMERFAAPLASDRKVVGPLYAANTFGAVLGLCAATFVLMPLFGFTRTLLMFSGANILCAASAGWLARRSAPAETAAPRSPVKRSSLRLRIMVFSTGLLGIGYEVAGMRVLAQVLENTIYTFASALAVYLCGTASGAAFYQRFLRRADPKQVRSWLLLIAGAACLGGIFLLSKAQVVYSAARSALPESLLTAIAAEVLTATAVFFVPTVLMGALFSHLIQAASVQEGSVGRATAANTIGSALAPVLFGIVLIPAIGTAWAIKIVVAGYVAVAIPGLVRSQFFVAFALLALALIAPSALQRTAPPVGGRLLEYREGIMDSVAVVQHADGNRSLLVNNRFTMGGTGAASAERRHAHIPLLLHPDPKRALFLGLGTGITFAAAGAYPALEADGVELIPEIVEVLPWFEPENAMPELGQRLRIHVADARRFVRVTRMKYDVIVADLFHPARDGAGTLYTREHFQALRECLATNGVFCQWLPLYQLDEPTLKVITKTFLDVFPAGTAWLLRFNVDTPVVGLIGGLAPDRCTAEYFEARVKRESPLANTLNAVQLRNSFELFGGFLANADELRAFAESAAVSTDDQPLVVFGAPRLNYQRQVQPYGRLLALLNRFHSNPDALRQRTSVDRAATDQGFAGNLKKFIAARDLYLRALVDEAEARSAQALETFLESAGQSEHFTMAYARCLTLATQQMKDKPAAARIILERLDKAQPNRPVARQLLERLEKN